MKKLCPHKFNQLRNVSKDYLDNQRWMYCQCDEENCQLWWKCKDPTPRTVTEVQLREEDALQFQKRIDDMVKESIKKHLSCYEAKL